MATHTQLIRTTGTAPPQHRPAPPAAPISSAMNTEGQELITAWGLVLEATSFTTQRLSEGLERAGVSAPFFDVLVRLAREPSQRLPMTKLANEVSLTSGGFTKLADRMEQEGLLYRQHSAQDRRVIYAVLTDAGRAAAAKIFPSHVADLRRHVEGVLGVDGAAQLAALCRKLRDANTTAQPAPPGTDAPPTPRSAPTRQPGRRRARDASAKVCGRSTASGGPGTSGFVRPARA